MSLKLNGATSGSIELDVPAAIGSDLSVTLPAKAGEVAVIDSSGRLLVGTTTPVNGSVLGNAETRTAQFYTTVDSGNQGLGVYNVSANPFAARLELGTGKPSFAALGTNNYLGVISFVGSDGSKFVSGAMISAETDATVSANDLPTRLVFSTTADGASSPTERMRISSAGRVSIGTATISAKLSIWENASVNEPVRINDTNNTNGHTHRISFRTGDVEAGKITSNRTSTNYVTTSDYRLKENVVDIADGIARIKQLQPNRFNFIADPDKTVDGFLAHEVQPIVPEAIIGTHDEVDNEGNPIYQGIDQSKLVPLLTAALQEAIAKIETLEAKVAALEANP